jgi:hypothetical protein
MPIQPRQVARRLEAAPALPAGTDERFSGYGVMGLPFRFGHVLALRRFTATSIGPGYASVWHRRPDGSWVLYTDVGPGRSCPRFFGADAAEAIETRIDLEWLGPYRLRVVVPSVSFEWEVTAAQTAATRLMNAVGRIVPESALRRPSVLSVMSGIAGPLLGAGRVGLRGIVPNGQYFIATPRVLWVITDSRARLGGEDFGLPAPSGPRPACTISGSRSAAFWPRARRTSNPSTRRVIRPPPRG